MTAVRVDLASGATETLWQSRYGAYVGAWTPDHLARRARRRLHDGRRRPLRGRRSPARAGCSSGTPIEEREPESRGPALRVPGRVRNCERPGAAATTTLYDDTGSLGVPRSVAARRGRARRDRGPRARGSRRARGDRPPRGRPLRAHVQHRRLLLGVRRRVRRGGRDVRRRTRARRRRRARGRRPPRAPLRRGKRALRAAFCTATSPTQLHVLPAEDAPPATLTRERALGLAPELLSRRRGRVVRVARRSSRVRAPVPAFARARLRGAASARVLRPRRAAEPGAPGLRVVLDAARPDPHPRGLRRVRPERPRVDGLRARLLEARRPRLGWARPARPRACDDGGAPARRAGRRLARRGRRALVRRLHDADTRRAPPGALAGRGGHVRAVRPVHVHGAPARDLEAVLRARGRRPREGQGLPRRALAEDAHRATSRARSS